jgi:hypothetical protein
VSKRQPARTGSRSTGAFGLIPVGRRFEYRPYWAHTRHSLHRIRSSGGTELIRTKL